MMKSLTRTATKLTFAASGFLVCASAHASSHACASPADRSKGFVLSYWQNDHEGSTIQADGFPAYYDVKFEFFTSPIIFASYNCAAKSGAKPTLQFDLAGNVERYAIDMTCSLRVENPDHPAGKLGAQVAEGWSNTEDNASVNLDLTFGSGVSRMKIVTAKGATLADMNLACKP